MVLYIALWGDYMETNDILNFSIPSHGGGIGKTYEESIIVVISMEDIDFEMKNKLNYVFFHDKVSGYIGLVGSGSRVATEPGYWIDFEEILKEDRYQILELLNILPINQYYAIVELIDPRILKEHLSTEREFKLNRRFTDGRY